MGRQQLLVLAVMLSKQVQPEKISVLKFVPSAILSTQESRSLLIPADVLTDLKSVSTSQNNLLQLIKRHLCAALFFGSVTAT